MRPLPCFGIASQTPGELVLCSSSHVSHAAYGYDVRAEAFGTQGMVTVGDGGTGSTWRYGPDGVVRHQATRFQERFVAAYTAELAHFIDCVATGKPPAVSGHDGHASLAIARAAIESVQTGQPIRLYS